MLRCVKRFTESVRRVTMKVNEIFFSLSGEGIHAGIPTVFVRLTGCNLRCDYCDTQYAWEGGEELSIGRVANRVRDLKRCGWVLITGGEPLLQLDAVHETNLVEKLCYEEHKVEIETNGSVDPPSYFKSVSCWSVDVKCPSSGPSYGTFRVAWLKRLRKCDQLKFVVGTEEDLDFVCEFLNGNRCRAQMLISPLIPNSPNSLTGDVLMSQRWWLQHCAEFCKKYNVRLSLQLHKIIYGDRRGV